MTKNHLQRRHLVNANESTCSYSRNTFLYSQSTGRPTLTLLFHLNTVQLLVERLLFSLVSDACGYTVGIFLSCDEKSELRLRFKECSSTPVANLLWTKSDKTKSHTCRL